MKWKFSWRKEILYLENKLINRLFVEALEKKKKEEKKGNGVITKVMNATTLIIINVN